MPDLFHLAFQHDPMVRLGRQQKLFAKGMWQFSDCAAKIGLKGEESIWPLIFWTGLAFMSLSLDGRKFQLLAKFAPHF
jgi:hypothetical protein